MKIILSRKGFDSAAGRVPSPIYPDGTMCSLPIPDDPTLDGPHSRYAEVSTAKGNLGAIVESLTNRRIMSSCFVHLDPDLSPISLPRPQGWRAVFGQAGAAEKHLQNQSVGEGDLFLFFGWFRNILDANGEISYAPGEPDKHVIFGWLQVERRLESSDTKHLPDWAYQHPHYGRTNHPKPDSLYVSTLRLEFPHYKSDKPGGGLFRQYADELCLTIPGQSKRSHWRLPIWFDPKSKPPKLSYHPRLDRWRRYENYVSLETAGRGQEFVLDCEYYPEALDWAMGLIERHS